VKHQVYTQFEVLRLRLADKQHINKLNPFVLKATVFFSFLLSIELNFVFKESRVSFKGV
jgi:hypothetical protein